jgi:hypothetical protein
MDMLSSNMTTSRPGEQGRSRSERWSGLDDRGFAGLEIEPQT